MSERNKNDITRRDHQHTIRFETIAELHNAVLVYGGARPAALNENVRQIGEAHDGMRVVYALEVLSPRGKSFAQRVVDEIGYLSPERASKCGSWDYDGPGPFHKASIYAQREADGTFSLGINAAFVGNQPEIRLAEAVGAPIGYGYCEIERTYAVTGERFAIPMKDIEAVYTALGQVFDQKVYFDALTTPQMDEYAKDRVESHVSPVTVTSDGELIASVGFTRSRAVPAYQYEENPSRDYEYRIEDGNLTGPARLDRTDKPESIGFYLSIGPLNSPTYDKKLEQRIRDMGDAAEVAWKATLAAPSARISRSPEGPK